MKISALQKNGKQIIQDIFQPVLKSENKEDWKKAFKFIDKKIAVLKLKLNSAVDNQEQLIIEIWNWENTKRQISVKFGEKFIKN